MSLFYFAGFTTEKPKDFKEVPVFDHIYGPSHPTNRSALNRSLTPLQTIKLVTPSISVPIIVTSDDINTHLYVPHLTKVSLIDKYRYYFNFK